MDIAYAFKRQYEDSIVKFIRRTSSYQHETSTIDEDGVRLTCKSEDLIECEQQQDTTVQIRVRDLRELSYTVSADSWVEHGIDIEDMDVKLRLTEMDTPPPAEESMNAMDSYNQAHEETVAGHSNLNESESNSVRSDVNDKLVPEADETDERPSMMLFDDINVDYVEMKYVPNCTAPCASQPITLKSTTDDLITNQRIDDDDLQNENFTRYELTNNLNENEEESRPKASTNECLTCCFAPEAVDSTLECGQDKFQVLRSNRIDISSSLNRDILSKIYTEHRNRPIKPYRCDVCFRWFKTKGHIKAHRIRHIEGEKRIKCRKCRLTFLTKPHLRNHNCLIKFY